MKKILKIAGFSLLAVIAALVIYLIAAFTIPYIGVNIDQSEPDEVTIYILTNGMHTDLVVPKQNEVYDWTKEIQVEHTLGKDSSLEWIALGWGDQGIYLNTPTWDDLEASTALSAAFGISKTAIHATWHGAMRIGDNCKKIELSRQQYATLVNYISASFQRDNRGQPLYIETTAQYGQNDAFYEAEGKYSFFHTCNTWANNGLKQAGQKTAWWTPFDWGIFHWY